MANRKSNRIKVLHKLYQLHRDGADFVETRWRFDWDTEQGRAPNIVLCIEELLALNSLSQLGVITMVKRSTNEGRTPWSATEFNWLAQGVFALDPATDYASHYFDTAVWLTSFNYEKLKEQCAALSFDPSVSGTYAELSFVGISTPVISMDGTVYRLTSLSEGGKPFNIISYCLARPGTLVRLDELRQYTPLATLTNINQALKRSLFDGKHGLLRNFVQSTPDTIIVSRTATLSDHTVLQLIQNADHIRSN